MASVAGYVNETVYPANAADTDTHGIGVTALGSGRALHSGPASQWWAIVSWDEDRYVDVLKKLYHLQLISHALLEV